MHDATADSACREIIRIVAVNTHPDYDPDTVANDIVLLELEHVSKYSRFSVDLFSYGKGIDLEAPGTILNIAGWGTTAFQGAQSRILKKAQVPIVDFQTCSNAYNGGVLQQSMQCAGNTGPDSCQGDSGGPLFHTANGQSTLVGIV